MTRGPSKVMGVASKHVVTLKTAMMKCWKKLSENQVVVC